MPPSLIRSSSDLVTSRQAICEGFLSQAVEKTQRAIPYIKEAEQFWSVLKEVQSIHELVSISSIRNELLAASGFSQKAKSYFTEEELKNEIERVIETLAEKMDNQSEESNDDWKTELFYQYLLTCGDSLGGSMRNFTGALASKRFTDFIIKALSQKNTASNISYSKSNSEKIQSIRWQNRLLVFDRTPSFLKKNIDLILLDISSKTDLEKVLVNNSELYVACGELKGGIDPAGADEHWKTANSALDRIRVSFKDRCPQLFFVGAAIANSMAQEIFSQISNGSLSYAANLTVPQQVAELASWLVEL